MKKANCIYKNEDCPICPRKKKVSEMTNEQILYKAVRKAVKNGYKLECQFIYGYRSGIFDHDFTKAFWGEGLVENANLIMQYQWQYHLQQMVISEEPLKYIEKFL